MSIPNVRMRLDDLDRALTPLDALPRDLWQATLGNGCGTPAVRLSHVIALHDALLAGALNSVERTDAFADTLNAGFRAVIGALRLPAQCLENPDEAKQVVRTLLWHVDRIAAYQDHFDESHDAARARAVTAFEAEWQDTAHALEDVLALFDALGGTDLASHPSEMKGLLARAGWAAVKQAHAMLHAMPELQHMIQSLGRSVPRDDNDDAALEPFTEEFEDVVMAQAPRPVPLARHGAEIEAITRSNDLSAMTSNETLYRRHRVLRRVWQVRYIEQTLITYDRHVTFDAPVSVPVTQTRVRAVMRPPPQQQTGPIIVCVDTSSSMRGAKEWVAKATVFEAMRVAHKQQRACYLYAFSDADSVLEAQLGLSMAGLTTLVDFLELSFHGGTDIAVPIERAVARVRTHAWRAADILIASDGEFGVPRGVEALVADAKQALALKVVAVLIGDRETLGVRAICDENLWIKDWRRYESAGDASESPVHHKSLTAMYFPGALRS